ncbi:MAG: hypothetical protein COU63_04360 [Candidatus Pacebacteria bacterium CG10_big_fil_rev_8_21_14_0_10_36_11]|nr:hypothetical protein [Candidatus Pacearchaeota archaeon]OIP74126.1 MAG: hypothetical protein AUK08_02635 [Candidatus Pacebacteria bacterium CG2_30_36_39]PIR64494.1 MAG: hypothetical protein COU63_04360 [Candidatus Pacebacteria bacterium CG10_big_fil_rev_8_21_14_0_10_36_11]PJC42983.1 MAG: hypothetical protein CO040_01565 [Candidatus Pacebacteria bacterium CG_4_9_14_0_2_um_filter_36_8]
MLIVFTLIPVLAILAALFVYRHNGKKEILRFDMVQFFYAFILMPTVYVWFKGFLYLLLKTELNQKISQQELFFYDTAYSIFFLFIFAFAVIHSLTKSFELKIKKDPLYDLFEHSEYYHLWLSHTIFFVGSMILSTSLAIFNIWFDLPIVFPKAIFYFILLTTPFVAMAVFKVFKISDFGDFRFLKLMKLFNGLFFLIHGVLFIVFEPVFMSEKLMYWYLTNVFGFLSLISIFHSPEPKPDSLRKRIAYKAKVVVGKLIHSKK